jgi:YfiH family protein
VIGAAHAGWKGALTGVLEATVAAMHTPAPDVVAWLGPAAGPAGYEVGVDVYDAFVSKDWTCARAFASTRPHHWRVDLYALARRRLEQAGVDIAAIHGGGLSTIAEPSRFFSHRRDRRTGRMASLVWKAPD